MPTILTWTLAHLCEAPIQDKYVGPKGPDRKMVQARVASLHSTLPKPKILSLQTIRSPNFEHQIERLYAVDREASIRGYGHFSDQDGATNNRRHRENRVCRY